MASLGELLAEDGFKKVEQKPGVRASHAGRGMSMPLRHGGGTNLPSPSANPRLGEGKARPCKSLLTRKSWALGRVEGNNRIPAFGVEDFDALLRRGLLGRKDTAVEPRLDEAATRALISILSDYIRCFFKDENFRSSVRQRCYYCLRFSAKAEDDQEDSGLVANLNDAIETIERSVQEFPDAGELNKSCVQLSIITTGWNSSGLNGSSISGIPSSRLSACAHLYLSVIYKLQKRDRACAAHLLKVFCDSPFEARTVLLSDLWESFLLPHLHHLEAWYVEEAEGMSDTPCRQIKMKLLERVYSDALDKGTYQIATYYKKWVMGEKEGPRYPSISIPSTSFFVIAPQVLVSPSSTSVSSRPLISRKLYESIFNRPRGKDVANEQEDGEEWDEKLCCVCRVSSCGRDVDQYDEMRHYSPRLVMHKEEDIEEDRPMCSSSMHASVCASQDPQEVMLEEKALNTELLVRNSTYQFFHREPHPTLEKRSSHCIRYSTGDYP